MKLQQQPSNNLTYETNELKLAALLMSEIPNCSIEIYEHGNSIRKTIKILYPAEYKNIVYKLEKNFINKEALTNIYSYNRALNMIRDRLRGEANEHTSRRES